MPKGIESKQLGNAGTAQNISNTLSNNASSIYGGLEPELQSQAAAPSGYTPTQIATQNTAAQQSGGGSQAATVGQGGLYEARTGNAGGAQNAIGAGTRSAGANLSKAAVGNQTENANLQQQQRQSALQGLGGLYSTDLSGAGNALNLSNLAYGAAEKTGEANPWNTVLETVESGPNTNTSGHGASGSTSSGCWLTTACTQYAGLPDDCQQLTILRNFRDGYMRRLPNGETMASEYYKFAPRIVDAVNASGKRSEIYLSILKMVNRCVVSIRSGHKKRALNVYASCYLELKRKFLV
jgi:hypothetical protein